MDALTLPDLDIVRTCATPISLRADDETDRSGLGLMEVRFSVFDTWYRISSWWEGDFYERTVRGAFKRTINAHNSAKTAGGRAKTLFNHGMDFHIGDKLLGRIESLTEEADSPLSLVDLYDTSYNRDLLPGLQDGEYGSSFMFRVVRDEWNQEPEPAEHNPEGLPERTVKEVRLYEAGPVTWPANPDATAGMRSATDAYYEHLARRDPSRVEGLRSRISALRSAGPAARTPQETGPATAPPTDPAQRHSGGLTPGARRRRIYALT